MLTSDSNHLVHYSAYTLQLMPSIFSDTCWVGGSIKNSVNARHRSSLSRELKLQRIIILPAVYLMCTIFRNVFEFSLITYISWDLIFALLLCWILSVTKLLFTNIRFVHYNIYTQFINKNKGYLVKLRKN